jgi:hypothetical protein
MRASVDHSGRVAAWERRRTSAAVGHLWIDNLETLEGREIGAVNNSVPAFVRMSPDGLRVAYHILEGTNQAIYVENVSGPHSRRRICEDCGAPSDWDDSGTHILYTTGGRPNGIGLLEIESGRSTTLLNHPSYGLHGARYHVDARGNGWMALYADTGPRTRQIFQAPVRDFRPSDYSAWIPVTDGANWDLAPAWAPDGHSIFFVSHRDGHRCIWNQALDPVSRRPQGQPKPLYHFHSPAQTLMRSVNYRGAEQLSVADGRLFFSLDQTASSLWLRE